MAHLFNHPADFVAEAITGFCDLHAEFVRAVPGGVVAAAKAPEGKVAVIVGGGSGHYPAFAGYVGPGFADAAVMGDVFASPSTRQVQDVARLAEHGGGVLLTFGNYAGDVLNFTLAAERLRTDGLAVEIVTITDDVASAPAGQLEKRRGVAGTVVVTKVAGAAAAAGMDLAGVTRMARATNAATRSFGVAFGGCTLPGAGQPLFTVEPGRMATGLGIHGEPGVDEVDLTSADDVSARLADAVLAERPDGADGRVAVILNGLGSTKQEELFVLWSSLAPRLREEGLELVAPEVGELITSLDMAGVSLTVCWLDDETLPLWTASGQCPALRRGDRIDTEPAAAPDLSLVEHATEVPEASRASAEAARAVQVSLSAVAAMLDQESDRLGRIDAIAGDGDHGLGMARGSAAAAEAAVQAVGAGAGVATTLRSAADAWADKAGGTSGALWGVGLRRAADEFDDQGVPGGPDLARAVRAALAGVVELGSARAGDKTLVDALIPLVDTFESRVADHPDDIARAWSEAAAAATRAAEQTADLVPQIGRARPLAERSKGHPDAGAVSLALCAQIVAGALTGGGAGPSAGTDPR